MDADLRIVTKRPLEHLWQGSAVEIGTRLRALTASEIAATLRNGRVQFVVADVGHKLRWIAPAECYEFWKSEVKPNLAIAGSRLSLGNFPQAYCYTASAWEISGASEQVIVLERHH
jgi:hypothetical protein